MQRTNVLLFRNSRIAKCMLNWNKFQWSANSDKELYLNHSSKFDFKKINAGGKIRTCEHTKWRDFYTRKTFLFWRLLSFGATSFSFFVRKKRWYLSPAHFSRNPWLEIPYGFSRGGVLPYVYTKSKGPDQALRPLQKLFWLAINTWKKFHQKTKSKLTKKVRK